MCFASQHAWCTSSDGKDDWLYLYSQTLCSILQFLTLSPSWIQQLLNSPTSPYLMTSSSALPCEPPPPSSSFTATTLPATKLRSQLNPLPPLSFSMNPFSIFHSFIKFQKSFKCSNTKFLFCIFIHNHSHWQQYKSVNFLDRVFNSQLPASTNNNQIGSKSSLWLPLKNF